MSRFESFPPMPLPAAPTALADALGAIRAQIKVLEACEAELCRALIEAGQGGNVAGAAYVVALQESRRRVIDPSHLPAYIRDDPAFYRDSRCTTVLTTPAPQAETPGDEDFEVIERFG